MSIPVRCPNCAKSANLPDSAAGKSVKCGCGTSFKIPEVYDGMIIVDASIPPVEDSPQDTDNSRVGLAQQAIVVNAPGSEISTKAEQIRKNREDDEAGLIAFKLLAIGLPSRLFAWVKARFKSKQKSISSPSIQRSTSGTGTSSDLKVCPKCGVDWLNDARFCVKCAWDSRPEENVSVGKPSPPDPSMLTNCPACGATWLRFQIQCPTCNFDALKGRRVAPARTEQTGTDQRSSLQKSRLQSTCLGCFLFFGVGVMGFVVFMWHIGESQKNRPPDDFDARVFAKRFVEENLKSPSTASFPWGGDKVVPLGGGKFRVSNYVDAQNGFGAMIRSHWVVTLTIAPDKKSATLDEIDIHQ